MDFLTSMDNKEFGFLFLEELIEMTSKLESSVYGEISNVMDQVGAETDKKEWTQAGAAMAFIAMKNTLEYLKTVVIANIQKDKLGKHSEAN